MCSSFLFYLESYMVSLRTPPPPPTLFFFFKVSPSPETWHVLKFSVFPSKPYLTVDQSMGKKRIPTMKTIASPENYVNFLSQLSYSTVKLEKGNIENVNTQYSLICLINIFFPDFSPIFLISRIPGNPKIVFLM